MRPKAQPSPSRGWNWYFIGAFLFCVVFWFGAGVLVFEGSKSISPRLTPQIAADPEIVQI